MLLLPLCARAQDAPAPKTSAAAPAETAYAPVRLEGRKLFEVMGTGPLAAAQRADRIQRRLQNLITREEPVRPFNEQDIRPQPGGSYLVTLGSEAVMSVTPADAEDSLASPNELALLWGQKMAGAVVEAREARANPLRGAGILIRNSFRDLVRSTLEWLPRLAGALVLWLMFWLLAKAGSWIVRLIGERTSLDGNLRQLARAVSYYGIWAVGVIAILTTLGFESGGIVAALGVSGFILGFAFKDILSHFLAGLLLLVGRQFRIGDQIVVKEFEGTVERIELRALHLRTYDNRLVILPNGDVFTSAV
ncbi:MAG TPA: mechanosensitive ion channel domain-containing protein, partial [Armatimonadota bacterium]|nr:mechanosensitive ion channel domain-containing protein [Armatimonadota bacterium]